MNENIEAMLEELRKEFPKKVYQELDLIIYDRHKNNYFLDDEFQEKKFRNLFINYKTSMVEIVAINTMYLIFIQAYSSSKKS